MENNRVLVTGASGFVGRYCCAILAAQGYEVHAVSSVARTAYSDVHQWHMANLLDANQLVHLLKMVKPTSLLHLAWEIKPGEYGSRHNIAWVQSSLELLQQFQRVGGERVVFAGSGFEYDWAYGYCTESITPSKPNTYYGHCKNATRLLLSAFCEEFGLSGAWARIFFVYGPGENRKRLVASVITALLNGENAVCSHGRQIRDFLHVADVASAMVSLLGSEVKGVVNIGSGRGVAIRELVEEVGVMLNATDRLEFGGKPAASNDRPYVVANVERLCSEVGWSPKFDLTTGLVDTIDWWRSQNGCDIEPVLKGRD